MPYKMNRSFTYLLVSFFLAGAVTVEAQNPTGKPKTTAPPANPVPVTPITRISTDISDTANENKLVALALQGPEYDASIHKSKVDELELRRAKATWLNLLSISTNYNDQSFAKKATTGTNNYVYPKYYFGITIPLGIIFSQGNTVKMARESIAQGKDQQEILARQIKVNVLSKYKEYKLLNALIEMESETINDVQANFSQAEDNFRKGTVESYMLVQRAKNDELTKVLNLQFRQDLIRLDIERMIGVPLDHVLRPVPGANPTTK
jgi:outer membrane protein TolC